MNTYCIRCVKNERTGHDLLCDECREPTPTPTPTPWKVGDWTEEDDGFYIVTENHEYSEDTMVIRGGTWGCANVGVLRKQDADLIVRAVNNLDDLLSCARGYLNTLEGMERTDASSDAKAFVEKTIKAAEGRAS